jgi:DNA-directed RNA polymerase specialized sigma24 family protein
MGEIRTAGRQDAVASVAAADFENSFRAHLAPVYRFIARRVGADLAEDLAAEVFATAYRRRGSYEPSRGSLRSWLRDRGERGARALTRRAAAARAGRAARRTGSGDGVRGRGRPIYTLHG